MNASTQNSTSSPRAVPHIPVYLTGMSLGLFLAITYVLCVVFDLIFPDIKMYESWLPLLPGVTWLDWTSFLLGLAESFFYGWYVALIFAPIFNYLAGRSAK